MRGADDWLFDNITVHAAPRVRVGLVTKCWCGRKMKIHKGDDEGFYCRKHGLQAYVK